MGMMFRCIFPMRMKFHGIFPPGKSFWAYLSPIVLLIVLIGQQVFSHRHQFLRAFECLFLGTAFFVTITLIGFIGNIENYSQRAAIEFFKERVNEDCYVMPYAYKSYGQLFYTQKPIVQNEKSYDKNWLLHGEIDKDVYIITKVHRVPKLLELKVSNLEELDRKNGFVFFKRSPSTQN